MFQPVFHDDHLRHSHYYYYRNISSCSFSCTKRKQCYTSLLPSTILTTARSKLDTMCVNSFSMKYLPKPLSLNVFVSLCLSSIYMCMCA